MTTTVEQNYDSLITGFKPFDLIDFLVAMLWVGVSPVLVPTYILSVTSSATDVALMLALMSLGAFVVPTVAGAADKYRAHRPMLLFSLLMAASYALLGFTQRPLAFALIGTLAGLGLVNSFYDPERDEGAAFEEQIGFHGGLGGAQALSFLLYPSEWSLDPEEIVGAEEVYRLLKPQLDALRTRATI